ncbi:helix-turn-helix domain-containing protein [Nocardia sp. NPDC052566]|uniref:GbsR/MarR family transcriptional regulator n=1 Tax=Nocardia sp. NPDC052566 TaxID=3364330 RepID=UPI0037CA350F
MPGGRLTQQDRQHIANKLAQGVGYAEIARQLDRPTSTVSREVSRNGGPNRYHPERAHQATERRARRRRLAAAAPVTEIGDAAMRDCLEQFTTEIMRTGMPRTAASLLTALYTCDAGSLTAAELAQRLQVSPATVSAAVGMLEPQGLIRRERDAGSRRDRYVFDEDAWVRASLASARQVDSLAAAARRALELLGATSPAAARLRPMSEFLEFIGRDMVDSVERWQQLSARP